MPENSAYVDWQIGMVQFTKLRYWVALRIIIYQPTILSYKDISNGYKEFFLYRKLVWNIFIFALKIFPSHFNCIANSRYAIQILHILCMQNIIILKEPRGNLIKYFYVKWVLRGYISTMYHIVIEKHNIRILKMNCYRYQYLWKTWNIDFWISYNWKIIWNWITKINDKIHLYLSSKLVYNYYNVKSKYAWAHWQFFF